MNDQVYDRPPLQYGPLNTALQASSMAKLPTFDYYRAPSSYAPLTGFAWAAIGRRPVNLTTTPTSNATIAQYPVMRFQFGNLPSQSALYGQDGSVSVSTLFNCDGQTFYVPEDSLNGTVLPLPMRVRNTAVLSGYRITSGMLCAVVSDADSLYWR